MSLRLPTARHFSRHFSGRRNGDQSRVSNGIVLFPEIFFKYCAQKVKLNAHNKEVRSNSDRTGRTVTAWLTWRRRSIALAMMVTWARSTSRTNHRRSYCTPGLRCRRHGDELACHRWLPLGPYVTPREESAKNPFGFLVRQPLLCFSAWHPLSSLDLFVRASPGWPDGGTHSGEVVSDDFVVHLLTGACSL